MPRIIKTKLFSTRKSDYLKCEQACHHTRRRKGLLWSIWNLGSDLLAYLQPTVDTLYTGGSRQFYTANKGCLYLADNAALSTGDIDYTWAGWINTDVAATSQNVMAKWGSAGSNGQCEYALTLTGSKLQFYIGNGTTVNTVEQPTTIVAGTWYFVVLEHNSVANTISISLNNGSATSAATSISPFNSTHGFALGRAGDYTSSTFGGRLANFGFWKRTLTTAEKTWLYNQDSGNVGTGRVYGELGVAATDGSALLTSLVSYWNLNETSGTANAIDQHSTNDLTPTFAEMLSNTGFETAGGGGADVFGSWVEDVNGVGSVITDELVVVDAGSHSAGLLSAGGGNVGVYQAVATSGHRYRVTCRARSLSGTPTLRLQAGGALENFSVTTSFATYSTTQTSGGANVVFYAVSGDGSTIYVDTTSCQAVDIPAANGPSSDVLVDTGSVGTNHGELKNFASSSTAFSTNVPSAIGSGFSLSFDGTDDYVTAGKITAIQSDTFTFVGRFKSANDGTNSTMACINWDSSNGFGVAIYLLTTGVIRAYVGKGGGYTTVDSILTYDDNVWHSVALSKSGTAIVLYIDGAEVNTATAASSVIPWDAAGITAFGSGWNTGAVNNPLRGNLCDWRWFMSLLSPTDIESIHVANSSPSTPALWYTMSDGPPSNLVDGDPVCVWESSEGNRYQFIQETASKRPTYAANAFGTGKPGLLFDGVNDLLVKTTAIFSGASGEVHAQVRLSTLQSYETILASADEGTANYYIAFMAHALAARLGYSQKNNDTVDNLKGGTAVTSATNYVMSCYSDGSTIVLALSNVNETITVITGANNGDWFSDTTNRDNTTIGGLKTSSESNWLNGYIGKIIVTNALNASQRNNVINYLLGGI